MVMKDDVARDYAANVMQVVNMTPHDVTVLDGSGAVKVVYPKSGNMIRLKAETVVVGELPDGTPLTQTVFGEPQGLPERAGNRLYIVSQLVKSAMPERDDLLVPAEVVRDAAGQIIGCKSLGV